MDIQVDILWAYQGAKMKMILPWMCCFNLFIEYVRLYSLQSFRANHLETLFQYLLWIQPLKSKVRNLKQWQGVLRVMRAGTSLWIATWKTNQREYL